MKESLCENELQHLLMKRNPQPRQRELQEIYLPQELQQGSPNQNLQKPRGTPTYGEIDHDIAREIKHIQQQRAEQTHYMNSNRQFLNKFESINQMIKKSMRH
jgi:sigma54-dependent transcription regulator